MGAETEHFADEVGELLAKRIKAFAGYVTREWRLNVEDEKGLAELDLTLEQAEGWNRCCDSLEGAATTWLEEWGY